MRLIVVTLLAGLLAVPARGDTPCDFVNVQTVNSRPVNCSCLARVENPNLCTPSDAPCQIVLPTGFPCPSVPPDSPLSSEKIELGRLLFYDTDLSRNQNFSCASCHQQAKAFTDGLPHSMGSTGDQHPRGAMSLVNMAFAGTFNWADRATPALEQQMLVPLFGENPVELGMGGREDELFGRLQADTRYQRMFAEAFPGNPPDLFSLRTLTQAIASFERTLISGNTPFERYEFGDDDAISSSAIRGSALFFDSIDANNARECIHCHGGFNFTTSVNAQHQPVERQFFNTGLYNLNCAAEGLPDLKLVACSGRPTPGPGTPTPSPTPTCPPGKTCPNRCDGTGPQAMGCYPKENTGLYGRPPHDDNDMGMFKAPTLRNLSVTGPYMHDGSVATLEDVLDHYAAGGRTIADGPHAGVGNDSPVKSGFMFGFRMDERDKQDLLNFLRSLTDEEFLTNPRFADPHAPVRCPGDCSLDGEVTVNELVTGINISLDTGSLALCLVGDPNGDGRISVDELVRAISNALAGCA